MNSLLVWRTLVLASTSPPCAPHALLALWRNGLGRLPPSRQIVGRLGSWINPGRGAIGRLNQPEVPMLVASHVSGVANVVAAQRQIVLANNSVAHGSADVAPIGHLHTKCVAHWPGRKIVLHQLGPWRVIAHNRSWTGHRAGDLTPKNWT